MISWTRVAAATTVWLVTTLGPGGGRAKAQAPLIQHIPPHDSLVTATDVGRACRHLVQADQLLSKIREDMAGPDSADLKAQGALGDSRDLQSFAKDHSDLAPLCKGRSDDMRALARATIPSRTQVKGAADAAKLAAIAGRYGMELLGAPGMPAPSVLGINENVLLRGFTQFLVNRASLELELAFVDRMKEKMCTDAYETVFHFTCATLDVQSGTIDAGVMRELRSAMERDLRRLPGSVPQAVVADAAVFGRYDRRQQDLVLSAYFTGTVVTGLLDGLPVAQALVAAIEPDSVDGGGRRQAVLRDHLDAAARTDSLVLPVTAVLYHVGLAAQALPDEDGDGVVALPHTGEVRQDYFRAMVVNIHAWFPQLDNMPAGIERVLRVARSTSNAIAAADSVLASVGKADPSGNQGLTEYAAAVDDVLGMVQAWADVFEPVVERNATFAIAPYIRDIRTVSRQLVAEEYGRAATGLIGLASDLGSHRIVVPGEMLRFTSFAAALAQADSASQVAQVFEDYAAPVGGYLGKRRAKGTYVTVNAYLGASVGWERAAGKWGGIAGISAPVGIEAGWARSGVSLGFLAQLIDVGALASYRLAASADSLRTAPEVGFSQVFSPGLYAVLGFKNLPIALGAGVAYAPKLRAYANGTTPAAGATQTSLFVAVDVPVLRLR